MISQQILNDEFINSIGEKKQNPWREKKQANMLLAIAYDSVDGAKAIRLRECAKTLVFARLQNGELKLKQMYSCRVRLCPLCAWRRAKKTYYNNMRIIDYIKKNDREYQYLFLTLTCKNVKSDELNKTIDDMYYAWNKFTKNKLIKKTIHGFCRCFEITHDINPLITKTLYAKKTNYYKKRGLKIGDKNPNYDYYHPHFHVIVAVNKSYFKKSYITLATWAQAWQQALNVDYVPTISVKKCYGCDSKSVAECSKYAVKDCDYVVPDDWDLTIETVRTLDIALKNRRLIAYGGIFANAKKQLKLDDAENGDLIHVDETHEKNENEIRDEIYFWHTGYSQYMRND